MPKCVRMMSDCQEMNGLWFSAETNHSMSWCCSTSLLSCDVQVLCECALRQSTAIQKVKRVCADGLGEVKNGHGDLDRGTEGQTGGQTVDV
jgi:hypothetical protein